EAVPVTEEAVATYRDLARDNPAFVPDLAMSLNNLGGRYSEVGRRHEAVPVTEEAVALRRDLARDNPAFVPDLASALNNLGVRYSEVGRRHEAVPVAEEAVATYRDLARDNLVFVPDLASALNSLGIRYREVGRDSEGDAIWEATLAAFGSFQTSVELLLRRSSSRESAPQAVSDLTRAASLLGADDYEIHGRHHRTARAIRGSSKSEFDT